MFIMFWFFSVFAYLRSVTDTTWCCADECTGTYVSGGRIKTSNKVKEATDIVEKKRGSMEIDLKIVNEKRLGWGMHNIRYTYIT